MLRILACALLLLAGCEDKRPRTDSPARARDASKAPRLPRLQGAHHVVFDLAHNRLLAHRIVSGGLTIAAGLPEVAKYVNFGKPKLRLELNKRLDGRRVALLKERSATFRFPLSRAQASARQIVLHLKANAVQRLRLELNDKRLAPRDLAAGWQRLEQQLPAGALRAGENTLRLRWLRIGSIGRKAIAALERIHIGDDLPADDPPLGSTVDAAGKLQIPSDGGLAYYVYAYPKSTLRLRFSAQPEEHRCTIVTRLLLKGQKPLVVSRREQVKDKGAVETFVDLAPVVERVARLELTADGEGCRELAVEAAIVRPGPPPRVKRAKKPRGVLFWMIDNLRADRVTAYNPKTRVETPNLDRLAREGTVFRSFYSVGTESRVSHATLWTGLYPRQHRVFFPAHLLSRRWDTMPELIRRAGLTTVAWIANGFVSPHLGHADGWDFYKNHIHQGGAIHGEAMADRGIRYIDKVGDKRFFLYLGTIDVHVSWRGRQPWLDRYYPQRYRGPFWRAVWGRDVDRLAESVYSKKHKVEVRKTRLSDKDRERIIAVHDSTISYNDQQLGRLLAALEKKGLLDETMVIITADHGEELFEHGQIGHGHILHEELVAVPLIVRYPPLFGRGVQVREGSDMSSVLATILDAVGAPIPSHLQGASLLPLAQGVGRGYPRPALASHYGRTHVIRLEHFKLWSIRHGSTRLYDLRAKKREHEKIVHPLARRWLTDALSTFLVYQDRWRARWGVASNHSPSLAHDLESGRVLPPIAP